MRTPAPGRTRPVQQGKAKAHRARAIRPRRRRARRLTRPRRRRARQLTRPRARTPGGRHSLDPGRRAGDLDGRGLPLDRGQAARGRQGWARQGGGPCESGGCPQGRQLPDRLDSDTILSEAEDFARSKPWAVLAGGVALGIVAARFLKASSADARARARRQAAGSTGTRATGPRPVAASGRPAPPRTPRRFRRRRLRVPAHPAVRSPVARAPRRRPRRVHRPASEGERHGQRITAARGAARELARRARAAPRQRDESARPSGNRARQGRDDREGQARGHRRGHVWWRRRRGAAGPRRADGVHRPRAEHVHGRLARRPHRRRGLRRDSRRPGPPGPREGEGSRARSSRANHRDREGGRRMGEDPNAIRRLQGLRRE